MTTRTGPDGNEYAAFGNVETRNGLQERIEIPLMVHVLGLPRGGRILEVGCGRGIALPVIAKLLRPDVLTAIDIEPGLVALAEQRVEQLGVDAIIGTADVRDLPFEDGTFDMVIDFGTCYHVGGGRDGSLAALRQIERVLRPGGLFVHETPVAQHLAHPVRSFARTLPWNRVTGLVRNRAGLLWATRERSSS